MDKKLKNKETSKDIKRYQKISKDIKRYQNIISMTTYTLTRIENIKDHNGSLYGELRETSQYTDPSQIMQFVEKLPFYRRLLVFYLRDGDIDDNIYFLKDYDMTTSLVDNNSILHGPFFVIYINLCKIVKDPLLGYKSFAKDRIDFLQKIKTIKSLGLSKDQLSELSGEFLDNL